MINYENLPNQTTPLNKTNLNKMQTDIDNKIGDLSQVDWGTGDTKVISNMMNKLFRLGSIDDCDNITQWVSRPTVNALNLPNFGGNSAYVLTMNPNSNYSAQLAFGFGSDRIAIRRKNNSDTWSNWKYFYAEGQNPISNVNITYSSKFSTVDFHTYSKSGRIVNLTFRGLVNTAITSGETIMVGLPSNARGSCQLSGLYIGGHYEYEAPLFGYIDKSGNDSVLKTAAVSAGKWIHINVTYITSD